MSKAPQLRRRPASLLLALAAVALLAVCVASAGAASNIEGVWSFDGGQIAVHPGANGTFVGTVVSATTFAECAHPVEQEIWKEMRLQPDGSFWGLHQWYFENTCAINEELGPTVWRVTEQPDGSKYLRVCFSEPGTSQPTLAPDGAEAGVTYGCVTSALTAPLPQTRTASFIAVKQCVSGRHFTIHLAEPRYDPFETVRVTLKGHRFNARRKNNYVDAAISLKGLPPGSFTIRINATTALGRHLSGTRTYHTCATKPKRHKPARLRVSKPKKRS